MAAAVPVRADYDAAQLRALAKRSKDADQTRRLLALAVIYDGGSRSAAAKLGGVGLQTVRDWVLAFNAQGPAGLVAGKAAGQLPRLSDEQRQALARIVETGPIPAAHGVVRWRLIDLAQWIFDAFGLSISKPTLSRELRRLGFRKLSARPRHHAQDADAVRPSGGDCRARRGGQAARDLVPRRSSDRAEEQDHPPLGTARHAPVGAA
jgi:transposase